MIKALAKKGGVIQINFACDFLNERVRTDCAGREEQAECEFGDDQDELRAYVESHFARATLADVVAHIDHVVKIAGIDAVGIGSDFDGVDCAPVGLRMSRISESYPCAAGEGIHGGADQQDLRWEHAAADAGSGEDCESNTSAVSSGPQTRKFT